MGEIVHRGVRQGESEDLELASLQELIERLQDYFPPRAPGSATWRDLVVPLLSPANLQGREPPPEQALPELLTRLREGAQRELRGARAPAQDIVFVSHRRVDAPLAESIADEIVRKTDWSVWLDVWNPLLEVVGGAHLPAPIEARVTALIIEMGLINSQRVLALMTQHFDGSAWIPYEYGRVRPDAPFATEAAAYFDASFNRSVPEYLELGQQFTRRPEVIRWLS